MPGKLTTHVLDTASGMPAAGMRIELHRLEYGGKVRSPMSRPTPTAGRSPLLAGDKMLPGRYRLLFHVGDYFAGEGQSGRETISGRRADPVHRIDDANAGYHVPLLVSPWAYSTYRGS